MISGRRIVVAVWTASVVLACSVLLSSNPASAHVPVFSSGGDSFATAVRIDDIQKSMAFYGEVDAMIAYGESSARFLFFDGVAGETLHMQINIPDVRYNMWFCPDLFIFGPGLDLPNETTEDLLSIAGLAVPAGDGVVRFSAAYARNGTLYLPEHNLVRLAPPVFEPFGQVYYYERYEGGLLLPSTGVYHIAVVGRIEDLPDALVEDNAAPGKYLLVTGVKEVFGIADYVMIPMDWIMIHLFWGEDPLIFLMPTAAIVVLGMAVTLLWLQRRDWRPLKGRPRSWQAVFVAGLVGCLMMIGGAVNQLLFLVGFGGWDSEPVFYLVLVLQASGVVLGVLGYGISWSVLSKDKLSFMVFPSIIAVAALVIGAGFILGPVLFLFMCALSIYGNRKQRTEHVPSVSDSGKA